jgi:hypothetical protein
MKAPEIFSKFHLGKIGMFSFFKDISSWPILTILDALESPMSRLWKPSKPAWL